MEAEDFSTSSFSDHRFEMAAGSFDGGGEGDAGGGAVLRDDVSGGLTSGLDGVLKLGLRKLFILASQCFCVVAESLPDQPLFSKGAIGQGAAWN
jgi:hypothetical protein